MPDNPLVGWLNALASGAPHPWRESLAGGVTTTSTTTQPTTSTTLPRELLAALEADREPLSAERSQAIEAMLAEKGRAYEAKRAAGWRFPGEGRYERLKKTLNRLGSEHKLLQRADNGAALWAPDYQPTRAEARTVGEAFLHDMFPWVVDASERPPDPYRRGWEFDDEGGWVPGRDPSLNTDPSQVRLRWDPKRRGEFRP